MCDGWLKEQTGASEDRGSRNELSAAGRSSLKRSKDDGGIANSSGKGIQGGAADSGGEGMGGGNGLSGDGGDVGGADGKAAAKREKRVFVRMSCPPPGPGRIVEGGRLDDTRLREQLTMFSTTAKDKKTGKEYDLKPAEASKHFTYYLQCTQCTARGKCQRQQELVCNHCPSTAEMPENFTSGSNRWSNPLKFKYKGRGVYNLVRAGCDHLKTWHHFWRSCHLLYNDYREIQALPNGELRSDLEKFINDKLQTCRYGEVKEEFSQGNCLTMVDNKGKFENADWIIEYFRDISRHGEGMGGVGSREGGGVGVESGGGLKTMGSSSANELQGGIVASGGERVGSPPPPPPPPPLTLGGRNLNEMQMGGALASDSEGMVAGDVPSGEEGDPPPRPSVGADGWAGSLSSAGDKRKAPEDSEEDDDEVYLNCVCMYV